MSTIINAIKTIIIITFLLGVGSYFFLFDTQNSFDDMVFQEIKDNNYIIKNQDVKKSYDKWITKKIEKEYKK